MNNRYKIQQLCKSFVAAICVAQFAAPNALSDIASVPLRDFYPAPSADNLLVYPYLTRYGLGAVGDEARGVTRLRLAVADRDGRTQSFLGAMVIYTINGEPVSPLVPSPYDFNWDSTTVPDGTHALGVILVDGPANLGAYRVIPTQIVVDNIPGVVSTSQRLPVLGNSISTLLGISVSPDWVQFPGGANRVHATTVPQPYRVSPPAHTLNQPDAVLSSSLWYLESLTESNQSLYEGKPRIYRNRNGHPVTNTFYLKSPHRIADAMPQVLRREHVDGGRNDNSVSPFSTFVPDPRGRGWYGIDVAGRLFRVEPDGSVITVAGRVHDDHRLPYQFADSTVTDAQRASARRTVGNFAGGVTFAGPTDLAFDPRDANIVYVADYYNHRIAKVDLSSTTPTITTYAGVTGVSGFVDGPSNHARFDEPSSLVMAPDGTMYVVDHENNAIRRISPAGVVSTVARNTTRVPLAPYVVRLDSAGQLIVGELSSGFVRRINPSNGTIDVIGYVPNCRSDWTWIDVDWRGNVGPVDDILLACSTGGRQHTYRMAKDGTRLVEWPRAGGGPQSGRLPDVLEPSGHYSWVVAIDDEEARILYMGTSNMGLRLLRLAQADDPRFGGNRDTALQVINRAQAILRNGTVAGFPFGIRPSFTALRGMTGHGFLGQIANFDDLAALSDSALAAYIQNGFGGSVPRPELTGADLAALMYYVRLNSTRGARETIPVPALPADRTAPRILSAQVRRLDGDTFEVSWTSDEPAIGFAAFGSSTYYHRWSDITPSYSRSQTVRLAQVPAGEIHYALRLKDEAGNQTQSIDLEFANGPVAAPEIHLSVSPTRIYRNASVTLDWAAKSADRCVASGDWLGDRADYGRFSRGPLVVNASFTLTCTGLGGTSSKTVGVEVINPLAPPTLTFSASPASISAGGGSTLTWSTTNVTSCHASSGWSGSRPANGSAVVGPLYATAIYALTCVGPSGSTTGYAAVQVNSPAAAIAIPR